MSRPHGGKLVNLIPDKEKINELYRESQKFIKVEVSSMIRLDIENIASGLYSPLEGPLLKNDYLSVLAKGRLSDDTVWTVPITIDITEGMAESIDEGDRVVLINDGESFAVFDVMEKYSWDKETHCQRIYKTYDPVHPGVKKTHEMSPVFLGGKITLLNESVGKFPHYRLKPRETRYLFNEKKWKTIAGFQTRNAPHIGHEYVQKTALAFVDGLFINPLIGKKKIGDFTDEVIIESYEAMLDNYFIANSAILVTLEMEMRYAGPKEAIHHAIIRKNYGCTHFIVGRDHAGVGNFYGPFEAQEIFSNYPDLGIVPIFFRNFFHCKRCGGPQNDKICPHPKEDHVYYSGTSIRKRLLIGERPDPHMMRPEVVTAILNHSNPFVILDKVQI
jgi:sulfate adenylyltransferase